MQMKKGKEHEHEKKLKPRLGIRGHSQRSIG